MLTEPANELDLLVLKRAKARLLQKKIQLVKDYGIAYYRPHPGQDGFHRAALNVR